MADILEARQQADAGDFAGAESRFRTLMHVSRDRHAGNHLAALGSLTILYGRAGRFFEVYLLSTVMEEQATRMGPDADKSAAFAWSSNCGALSQLVMTDALAEALLHFRALLDRMPDPGRELLLKYHIAAAACAREQRHFAKARHHLADYQRLLGGQESEQPIYAWGFTMARSELCLREGDPETALEILNGLPAEAQAPHTRVRELSLETLIHVQQRNTTDAVRCAREAIPYLESLATQPALASDRIHNGTRLASAMETLGALDEAEELLDLVAAAVMIRLLQLDECMQQIPELGLETSTAAEALVAFRRRFLQDQQSLLKRISTLLASRGDAYLKALLLRPDRDGHIVVCAWCESVRPVSDTWLPIGHFIPRQGHLRLTHTMCPSCASAWTATAG